MRHVALVFTFLICAASHASLCAAQTCEVLTDDNGKQRPNGSRLCVTVKITNGAMDIDRAQSRFVPTDEFRRRLSIPPAEAEALVFKALADVLKTIPKPYFFGLSEADQARDNSGQINDAKTNAIRTANTTWPLYLKQYEDWLSSDANRLTMFDVFSSFESKLPQLVNAANATALLVWEDNSFAGDQGTFTMTVLDPITKYEDETQVKISLPDVPDGPKKDARRKRIQKLLRRLSGRPRCIDCIRNTIGTFYRGMGLDPDVSFDNSNTLPLMIGIIEGKRISSISWQSLKGDPNVDKLLYSLLTDKAFRHFLKRRESVGEVFNYREQMGEPGPYFNAQRVQIQQLLVTQLGYAASYTEASGDPITKSSSSITITIQKLSDPEEAANASPTPTPVNKTPPPAPPTANPEGVVTAHEQEKKTETDFVPKPTPTPNKPKDKKRYVGGGVEFRPGQGVKFFGLGQLSRFPFLPDSVNNMSVKFGGMGSDGALGSGNYFADYVLFNKLHRRVSLQFTVSSDLEADRNLTDPDTDERRRTGLARLEFEPFRDRSGSLLRFYAEGRHETVELKPNLDPSVKATLNTLEFGAFYFFESIEVELPRRIRFEPRFKFGLGLAVGEPRYNKLLATGNFHQVLPRRYEFDVTGRAELASREVPEFELPSLGGSEMLRGFRRDDGLGRKLWALQNELWIPLPVGNEDSKGLKAMLREKVKAAAFVDVGGLYNTTNVKPGMRTGTGAGLRFIYNPIIFKFDFGYGFGEKVTGGGRGKFHFSLSSNLPF